MSDAMRYEGRFSGAFHLRGPFAWLGLCLDDVGPSSKTEDRPSPTSSPPHHAVALFIGVYARDVRAQPHNILILLNF